MIESIEFETPTWNQIHNMINNLSEKILLDKFTPDIIISITRGGWIPARVLSDLLEINNLATIRIEFYLDVGKTRKKPILTHRIQIPITGKKILLVDDIADSGESLLLAKNYIQKKQVSELRVATIYKKPQSKTQPDYYEKTTRKWIIFPWEIKETSRNISNKNKKLILIKELESKKDDQTKKLFKKFLKASIE
jgi:hypoxanthine phosphoribosyltransferase